MRLGKVLKDLKRGSNCTLPLDQRRKAVFWWVQMKVIF